MKLYLDGELSSATPATLTTLSAGTIQVPLEIGRVFRKDWAPSGGYFNGIIDEVKIYNRALSPEEIQEQYEPARLSLTKIASPQSIKQGQATTITLTIKNTGSTEISDIEIADTIPKDLKIIGDTKKTYTSLSPQDSRQFQYSIQINEAGTFNLGQATASYADNKGNYQEVISEPVSIKVVSSPITTPTISPECPTSSAVLLHGEKTDVILGEDILLKLSAVNLITKPPMSVQVMIYPPSGMSVTGSIFVKSGAGIYTTNYTLNPSDGKDIEVHIQSNQVGDFNVKGRIVYYFGEEKDKAEDCTLNLPIKVRKEIASTPDSIQKSAKESPGFEIILAGVGMILSLLLRRR